MKLRALELEQFRKFDRPIRIADMDDGLNLVLGPNEMGKSTLFAALQAVLFERHRSQAQTVKSFQPAGHEGASPRVALQLEVDGGLYRIEKRFLRRPSAELTLPDGRHLHGEAAEEALEALLGGGGSGRRNGPEVQGVWSLIWVGQGQSFALPEIGSGARATLQSVLDVEVGEILGGDHGAELIARMDEALHELVYKAGRPCGRYKEADDARHALGLEIADLEARHDELERDLNELDRVRIEYERLRADQGAAGAERELAALAGRRDQLKVRQAELREAEAALATMRHDLGQLQAELARRHAAREALAAAGREGEQACAAEVGLAEAAAAAERLAAELAGKSERLQATLDAAETQQRALQRLAQAVRQRDDGRAALRAVASEVRLELEPQAWGRVRVAGRALDATSRWLRIVEPLDIEIADVGRIQVRPVVADHRRLQASIKDAERRIARELEALGLRTPNPKARQLEFELAADVPLADTATGLQPEAAEPPCWPEAAAVDTALTEAERQIEGVAAQLRPARRELDQATAARHETRAAHGQAVDRSAQAKRRLEQLRAELGEAERGMPEANLVARSAVRHAEVARAEAHLRGLQEQAPEESLEAVEQRMAGLRQKIDERAGALRERELTIERLRARIQALAGGGLDERLAVARRRFDELERECAKYRSEIEALELLLRVLRDAERAAKERYVGPLVRRIRPYLDALFPDADLEVDAAFRITTVARRAAVEPFERLSDGTREQIAVLARLAFAELLADEGRPAVVVLDDALAFSDDQRIEQMFDILVRAAAKLQIILLTCRERVFARLPARRLRLEQVEAAGVP
jgi:DNA repair exonuclease SbcCD ATPase subunit